MARQVVTSRPAIVTFGVLFSVDLVILALHALHAYAQVRQVESLAALNDLRFSIEHDRGYGERFEYAKTLFCMFGIGALYVRTGQSVYAALSLLYGFILLDNAARLHEQAGLAMVPLFAAAEGLFPSAPRALGEASFYLAVGVAACGGLAWAFRRSAGEHRASAGLCLLPVGVLAGFGFGIDFLHAAMGGVLPDHDAPMGFVEDGGELVTLSAGCAVVCALCMRQAARRTVAS